MKQGQPQFDCCMSDIHLSRSHALTPEQRVQVMSALAQYLTDTLKAKVEHKTGHLAFKGKGFSGHVALDHCTVEGSVRLGLMMKPMKGIITKEIGKVLDQYLGAS